MRQDAIFSFFSDNSVIQRITTMSEYLSWKEKEREREREREERERELVREALQPVAIFASKFSRPLFLIVIPLIWVWNASAVKPLSLQSCEIFKRSLEAISGCLTPDRRRSLYSSLCQHFICWNISQICTSRWQTWVFIMCTWIGNLQARTKAPS